MRLSKKANSGAKPSEKVVEYHLKQHEPDMLHDACYAPYNVVAAIEKGLRVSELEALRQRLQIPMEKLAAKLGISRATLHRRLAGARLGRDESDRVVRFARLFGKASEVFEGEENARLWLNAPQVGLGGAVPMDYAATEAGAREVESLLIRIDHAVYS